MTRFIKKFMSVAFILYFVMVAVSTVKTKAMDDDTSYEGNMVVNGYYEDTSSDLLTFRCKYTDSSMHLKIWGYIDYNHDIEYYAIGSNQGVFHDDNYADCSRGRYYYREKYSAYNRDVGFDIINFVNEDGYMYGSLMGRATRDYPTTHRVTFFPDWN